MLSESFVRRTMTGAKSTPLVRQKVAKSLVFGSLHWSKFDKAWSPLPCKPSLDPLVLALRRLAWPALGELSAMHRLAVTTAAKRPFGFQHLVLEEVAALEYPAEPPAVLDDAAFQVLFELINASRLISRARELTDLRARSLLLAARRQIALHDDLHPASLRIAGRLVREGKGDLELKVFLAETVAMALESAGHRAEALSKRLAAIDALCEEGALDFELLDRLVEATIDAAELMDRHAPGNREAPDLYEQAERLLEQVPPGLNQPLRRRLAAHRKSA